MILNIDALYFRNLDKNNDTLVRVDPIVIQAMAAFVFIAVLKDFLICFYLHWTYEGRGFHFENHTDIRK